ncbi:volume-regulated anion channel subunit LRRC8D-like [Callorhinchus milii]|uniref:volume-regulated anion channel subunit LRRC8D-like n=1 Tax=Callorhinchus milii TaxID=7868 RepID=UPI0004573E35|nr:volume-regulated anion channel subunit LRRC8D-like [Callorhinchus milii]|eukprot:gi/632969199/ref/XP_007900958.1/ PREDICTED: leucine-rich repeat-containing protein 8D-like [Callorhinchus milii]
MFTVSDVSSLDSRQPAFRIFKPWWDIFMDYLTIIMLMVSIFGSSTQLYLDDTSCLPNLDQDTSGFRRERSSIQNLPDLDVAPDENDKNIVHSSDGRSTSLHYWQNQYINQVCQSDGIPWFTRFAGYVILFHTTSLIICSNFCFTYPRTSSKVEQFIDILQKCFQSPWTNKALAMAVYKDTNELEDALDTQRSIESSLNNTISPQPSSLKLQQSTSFQAPISTLDKKDAEQAKALFEKVRQFRLHVEEKDTIYKCYVGQNLLKALQCITIISYMPPFVHAVKFDNLCEPNAKLLVGYWTFNCTYSTSRFIKKILLFFLFLVVTYGLLCIHTLLWVFRNKLKQYTFEKRGDSSPFTDIPVVKNDFAFLLHLIDQYDTLYCLRFGVFLSEVSEKKLRMLTLNHDWTVERTRQRMIKNNKDQIELHLFMVSGIPESVYDVTELQVLRLELCNDMNIGTKINQLSHLEEIWILHCVVIVSPLALMWLRNQLKKVGVKYLDRDEIPEWIYKLTKLQELYLTGKMSIENKFVELESMKSLRSLKVLYLKSNISKIPPSITDVAYHLVRFCIHNDKTKLLNYHIVKKMVNLTQLELHNCELDKIPSLIAALPKLQLLDLKGNNLSKIDDVANLQYMEKLNCLKFWFNMIRIIPSNITLIKSLKYLYLSHNLIEVLPNVLFTIEDLHYLDVKNNSITLIPDGIAKLVNLKFLDVSSNKIEKLPEALYKCTKLQTLKLNYNLITSLSKSISNLSQLSQLELLGNYMEKLPVEIAQCSLLTLSGLIVDPNILELLTPEVKLAMGGS